MTRDRTDEAAWDAQRHAQQWLSLEDRLRQNDALTRLFVESSRYRRDSGVD